MTTDLLLCLYSTRADTKKRSLCVHKKVRSPVIKSNHKINHGRKELKDQRHSEQQQEQ